jgi:DNA-binding NarL/FixJ family response regulator
MNKKAIAGILARLDDPEMIETVLDLIADKADAPPAVNETTGQLFSIDQNGVPKRRTIRVPNGRTRWSTQADHDMDIMLGWGYSYAQIAEQLGRTEKAVADRAQRKRKGEIAS